jgi:phenylalanyl-tRNA synthetase beta chain
MRVPISWLREYVPLEMPLPELAERLSVTTAEVDGIEPRGVADTNGNLGLFRVGKVVEAVKHPNADRLQLTRVDVGEGAPRQIVCGAWNFGAGATVAVALPGALLPNGLQLEQRKVRGELSDGMILAEDEVELGADHTGIMLLPETEPGTPLGDVLPLADQVLLVESTGNRPDLLSVYGLAREVAALYDLSLADMPGCQTPGPVPSGHVDVRIEDLGGCPRYIGRLLRGVSIGPSPVWLRARLLAAGVRSISNVVDVTNYVMLALGSPLHAFDHATLHEGRIVVRRAAPGETLRTLDGVERELDPRDLLIADADRGVALAGIMGGEETEIGEQTTDVLLEAANFEPFGLFLTSERQRLRTEGLNRWEKGVDPYVAEAAANHATELLVELAGAEWAADSDVHGELPARPVVRFRTERADEVVGIETPPAEQERILAWLGFERRGGEVVVPTWRARDVTREIDVVEEIARFRLDDVPFTLPLRRAMFGALTRSQRLRRRVEDTLVGLGLTETYTPSLRADDPAADALRLPEPFTAELAVLRTRLLPSLVEAARRNVEHGAAGVALFEIARVYLATAEGLPEERLCVAGILEGGFARAKGVVETLHAALMAQPAFAPAADALLHPAKAAATAAGVVGELHPALLDGTWGVFELDLERLFAEARDDVKFEDVADFPPVREDMAFTVAEEVPAGDLVAAMREAAGPELREVRPFDVYRGPQVGEGRKSIAFALVYQSDERTLADEDAQRLRARVVEALGRRFGAELRA